MLAIPHRAHGAGLERKTVHDAGVHLDVAHEIRKARVPDGMVRGIALHRLDPGLHGVQRRSAVPEHPHGRLDSDGAVCAGNDDHRTHLRTAEPGWEALLPRH
jgi:hypothetical protein